MTALSHFLLADLQFLFRYSSCHLST